MTLSRLFLLIALWGAAFTALALWMPRSPSFLLPIWFFPAWVWGVKIVNRASAVRFSGRFAPLRAPRPSWCGN